MIWYTYVKPWLDASGIQFKVAASIKPPPIFPTTPAIYMTVAMEAASKA